MSTQYAGFFTAAWADINDDESGDDKLPPPPASGKQHLQENAAQLSQPGSKPADLITVIENITHTT